MTDVSQQIKEIKQSFRQMMDGSVAQSMRDKGVGYHLNWGATLPRLREMAQELSANREPQARYDLAIALYKENVRECRILATMLMPPELISWPSTCGSICLMRRKRLISGWPRRRSIINSAVSIF